SWANHTLSDIGSEVTNSLDRQGRGGMLAPLKATNGSNAAPSLTFTSETTTGLYRAGAADVRMSIAGSDNARWTTGTFIALGTFSSTGVASFADGAVGAPGVT